MIFKTNDKEVDPINGQYHINGQSKKLLGSNQVPQKWFDIMVTRFECPNVQEKSEKATTVIFVTSFKQNLASSNFNAFWYYNLSKSLWVKATSVVNFWELLNCTKKLLGGHQALQNYLNIMLTCFVLSNVPEKSEWARKRILVERWEKVCLFPISTCFTTRIGAVAKLLVVNLGEPLKCTKKFLGGHQAIHNYLNIMLTCFVCSNAQENSEQATKLILVERSEKVCLFPISTCFTSRIGAVAKVLVVNLGEPLKCTKKLLGDHQTLKIYFNITITFCVCSNVQENSE